MVDGLRQVLAQTVQQILTRQAALRHQTLDLICAKRAGEIARRDLLVRSRAHPRIGSFAMTALLELLEQVAQSAAKDAARCASGEHAAQPTFENVAKASKTSTKTSTAHAATAGGWRRRRRTGRRRAATDVLDGLVGQQREDRHGHRRHSAAGLRARCRGAARAILHSVQYVE